MKVSELGGMELDKWAAKAMGYKIVTARVYRDPENGKIDIDTAGMSDSWDQPAMVVRDATGLEEVGDPYFEGHHWHELEPVQEYSSNWAAGGPLVEEWIARVAPGFWEARRTYAFVDGVFVAREGPTILVAAMRTIVASVYGEEVPE